MAPRSSSIEVSIRVRPLRKELGESAPAWRISRSTLAEIANPDSRFTFDHVYDTSAETRALYDECVKIPIVSRVVQGFNGTVFAYGQTGSGKSFTMLGGRTAQGGSPGLVSMAVTDIFTLLAEEEAGKPENGASAGGRGQVSVYVSIVEIYNEQLRDLMLDAGSLSSSSASPPPLSIRENEFGVYVHNAVRSRVKSAQECLEVIRQHVASRVSGATAMNENSSRSHCIIRLHLERTVPVPHASSRRRGSGGSRGLGEASSDDDDGIGATARGSHVAPSSTSAGTRSGVGAEAPTQKLIVSTLNLVDLAGSERVAKTGATGVRMVEGGHINKSLTTLTTVINRLTELRIQQQRRGSGVGGGSASVSAASSFVPYRDSRLTHLLKTAIGGNSFTCIFCCVTLSVENIDECRSTLQFASRAKHIENRVQRNEVADPQVRLREMERAFRDARRLLVAQTLYLWSKEVRIKNLVTQLNSVGVEPVTGGREAKRGVAPSSSSAAAMREDELGPSGQQRAIIDQLTAEKEALQEALDRARVAKQSGGSRADDGADKKALQRSLEELDSLCRQLEAENMTQAQTIKRLQEENAEAGELVEAVDGERARLQEELHLLQAQLTTTQHRLVEKHRGEAYLEELTRLHIDHQQLQHVCAQWKEKYTQETAALRQHVRKLEDKLTDLDDEKEEVKDQQRLLNSYLWRFVSVASLASTGRVVEDPVSVDETVPLPRVNAALRDLAQFVNARQAASGRLGESADQGSAATATGQAYEQRIRDLETELASKDALRDVIVDTKLKRIQELVLKLYAMNQALVSELRTCYNDNEQLFQITDSHTRIAAELSSAGLYPRSFQDALSRARYAPPAVKPFGHN